MHNTLLSDTILQNRYRVLRRLGQGGMGAVYLAYDLRLDKQVAIKETLDVSPQAQQQFGREARFLARLQHPHLPRVTDSFAQTGRYYLVMDYVPGHDLEAWVQQHGPASPAQALTWADQVLDALDYLHRQSPPIIHRDVKPANVKITPDGQALLVDFGIAKEFRPGQYTLTGARAYSPGYAPLEQYAARGQTDARTDVYGLGATLYFLLTGVTPVDALERAAGEDLPPPRRANPRSQISPAVEAVVLKALALQKQDRWQSAAEMRRALRQAAAAPAPRPAPSPRTPRPAPTQPRRGKKRTTPRSKPLLWTLGITAVVLVIALGLLILLAARGGGQTGSRFTATATAQANRALLTQTALAQQPPAITPPPPPTESPTPTTIAAIPTGEPTATPSPIPPTPTATPVPTSTPVPPTPTNTPKPVRPTATPQPTSGSTYPAPILAAPENSIGGLNGIVTFQWRWNGPALQASDYFDLRIWSEAERDLPPSARRGVIAPTKETSAQVNLEGVATIQEHGSGTYYWSVVVVRKSCADCPPKIIGEWSETRSFAYTSSSGKPGPTPTRRSGPGPTPTPLP
ncbi:MAG TPA: serine/threonine protein kinase [Anaerolineae bacterium]|nr:serine/threonine protein kinase [Anaerolineae bacterium]